MIARKLQNSMGSPICIDLLDSGYNATTAGATLKARNLTFQENLEFSKSITLKDGFAWDFSRRKGISTTKGTLTISSGTIEADTIAIQ